MTKPLVTVVMPAYNAEQFVAEAIESVLAQTFTNFVLLIINDGSTDSTPNIIQSYAKKDSRIKIVNQANKGLVNSLNQGIRLANTKYIARQDADDKSSPERLQKQVSFLENHPGTVIVGSSVEVIDEKSRKVHRHAVLLHDPELRQELLVRSPFAHGSVIFRRQAALEAGVYDKSAWPVEDYDLWLRLSLHGKMANIDDYLYFYREHGDSVSLKNAQLQKKWGELIRQKAWRERQRLLPNKKLGLSSYSSLKLGQNRIERIVDNAVFAAREALRNGDKKYAVKSLSMVSTHPLTYKKLAGKIKRRIRASRDSS